jgi:hypothetical protein
MERARKKVSKSGFPTSAPFHTPFGILPLQTESRHTRAAYLQVASPGRPSACRHSLASDRQCRHVRQPAAHLQCQPPTKARAPAPQALRVLADPSHPELVTHLRAAAAAICHKKRHDLRLWLEGRLFTHLLGILTALPTLGLSPALAAETCATAAATLCRVLTLSTDADVALPPPLASAALLAAACQPEVFSALVRQGIVNPEATRQVLPPGHEARVPDVTPQGLHADSGVDADTLESIRALLERPRGACLKLAALLADARAAADPRLLASGIRGELAELVDRGVFDHILDLAIHQPSRGT